MDCCCSVFQKFYNKKYVHQEDLAYLICNICKCLKTNFGKSKEFWYDMFAYYQKAKTICEWKWKNGYLPIVKLSEKICENKVEDIWKEHKDCSCSEVYF